MNNNRDGSNSSSSSSCKHQCRKVRIDSSFDFQTLVRANATSIRRVSDSLERKPRSSWQVKGHNSDGVAPRNTENVTPASCHDQRHGSTTFSGESSHDRNQNRIWKVKGHFSDLIVSRNTAHVTPAGHQGQEQDSSSLSNKSYFCGGRAKQWRASSKASGSADSGEHKQPEISSTEAEVSIPLDSCFMESAGHLADMSHLSLESAVDRNHSDSGAIVLQTTENERGLKHDGLSDYTTPVKVLDLCPPKSSSVITLTPSLFAKNKDRRKEMVKYIDGPKGIILRPGMVLLKNYLSISEQASIVKTCRTHGLGPAGFYQPLFREGGKLHMKSMCFGKFWDPETGKYGELRPMDHAKPPSIPPEFLLLVDRAMNFSHSLIAEHSNIKIAKRILPQVNPDICLVNYYARTGRLGLHQDKDESQESLGKGIPIFSFSMGDSAEFLYGDQSDAEKANKVILESGDVLIFGGKSRHIFHGVSAILPDTAPKSLLHDTNFRPGRLNLTFRQQF